MWYITHKQIYILCIKERHKTALCAISNKLSTFDDKQHFKTFSYIQYIAYSKWWWEALLCEYKVNTNSCISRQIKCLSPYYHFPITPLLSAFYCGRPTFPMCGTAIQVFLCIFFCKFFLLQLEKCKLCKTKPIGHTQFPLYLECSQKCFLHYWLFLKAKTFMPQVTWVTSC